MPGRTILVASLSIGLMVVAAGTASAAPPPAPAYVTPLIAHTAWTATEGCTAVPSVQTLPQALRALKSRGFTLTGTIVTTWIKPRVRNCIEGMPLDPFPKPILLPSWADLATLRGRYPFFDLVSAGVHYVAMTSLTPAQQRQEACGARDVLVAHGVASPIALYAYVNNKFTTAMNAMVRSRCNYVLGRRYSATANTPSSVASGFLNVLSINGGKCSDPALPCATLDTRFVYTAPSMLYTYNHPAPGTWVVPQYYRLVSGAKTSGPLRWNCNGPPASHFTFDQGGNSTELYCAVDYYASLASEPAHVVTNLNIRQVEAKWGLVP
jgi:hypothetical protein